MDPAWIVQTTNSWLLSNWYVPSIPLDDVRKISILGTNFYALRGHLDRWHQCKDISEPENVENGGYLRGFLVKHFHYVEKGKMKLWSWDFLKTIETMKEKYTRLRWNNSEITFLLNARVIFNFLKIIIS